MKAILGKKIGMTQLFADDKVIPVTLVEAGPCRVLQVKNPEKDGYEAVQIGYEAIVKKNQILMYNKIKRKRTKKRKKIKRKTRKSLMMVVVLQFFRLYLDSCLG